MTKAEFIIALKDALPEVFPTKTAAEKAYLAFCRILSDAAVSSDGVRLPRVGSFSVTNRAARTGRNPKTGEAIRIPARKAVKFTPSDALSAKITQ
ncbi:HU family DNA-binding protein [Desulfovibrio sp. OttesenSCG-928-G15]|nr:HU family DNA-binding protein [Desulfovibrio sp. OttesenSCG-928-G15]